MKNKSIVSEGREIALAVNLISADAAQFWQIVTAIGLTITPLLAKLGHTMARHLEMRASDAAPIVPSAAPSAATSTVTPPTAATPMAAGNQRPATNNTAAAVVLPSTSADYLNNPAPPYPRQSKRLGEQGTVIIRVLITPEGRAEKAEIRTSSGFLRLDETALSTVQRWRFVPGQRNGAPEAMWFNVPIRFVLD